MFQQLPVERFKCKKKKKKRKKKIIHKFGNDFIKNYDEDRCEYSKNLLKLQGDFPFLAERKKTKKCNKLVCNINGKENYVVHIRDLNKNYKNYIMDLY